ncbi:DUF2512 family protein [Lysinibacillus yapensis]|uniref:DUF2512 family protein n=1 Tax=Ureibacillus yapensis TaxID=2304605 RepID=A0A396SFN5_9BACL|nr:DUF2512 family protein [Lysinibacillus yapensis]RHW40095.1 DUF2512 family protein [Lysinibacillus yapensis]
MNHLKAIVIKFVMIAVVLGIILSGIVGMEFSDTLLISLVLTVLAYVVGDLGIFQNAGDYTERKKRNLIATISDVILAAIVIYFMGQSMVQDSSNFLTAAIISAIVIGLGEWFFHKYLDRQVFNREEIHHDAQRNY